MNTEVSFSPAIQGLLVSLNPEYEISNEAIAFVASFAENLISKLVRTACEHHYDDFNESPLTITSTEVERALQSVLPAELSRQAISEAAQALHDFQMQQKDEDLKDVISEFEFIDDNQGLPGVANSKRSIWFSPELVSKYLMQRAIIDAGTYVDNSGAVFLSSSLEYVVSRLLADVGRKSHPTLSRQACEGMFEEGESFYHVGLNLQEKPRDDSDFDSTNVEPPAPDDFVPSPPPEEDFVASPPPEEEFVPSPPRSPSPIPSGAFSPSDVFSDTSDPTPETSDPAPEIGDPTSETSDPAPEIQPGGEEFLLTDPQIEVPTFVAPLLLLLGQACSGFDATARGIQIMSSLTEYLIRFIVVESSRIALRRSSHVVTDSDVKVAFSRAIPEGLASEALSDTLPEQPAVEGRMSLFVFLAAQLVHPAWDVTFEPGVDARVTKAIAYILRRVFMVAASYARNAGFWTIRACNVTAAVESVVTTASPIWNAVVAAKQRSYNEIFLIPPETSTEEGNLLSPPGPLRVYAADKIYLTSIIHETPLQPDNQLLIMFLLLASMSLRAIIVA